MEARGRLVYMLECRGVGKVGASVRKVGVKCREGGG